MKNILFLLLSVILLSSCSDYSELIEVEVKEINGTKTVTYGEWVKEVTLPDYVKTIYVGNDGCTGCASHFPDEFLIIKGKVINRWENSNESKKERAKISNGKYYFNIKSENEITITDGWFLIDKEKIFRHSDNKKVFKTKRVYNYYLH